MNAPYPLRHLSTDCETFAVELSVSVGYDTLFRTDGRWIPRLPVRKDGLVHNTVILCSWKTLLLHQIFF